MATVQLKPPAPFDFTKSEEWTRWKWRFEQFRVASGLAEEDKDCQVSTLLYCMGEEAGDVLSTTEITDKERKKYETVMEKHDGFFKVHRNVIFECVRFNRCYQRAGETAEQYITVLYGLIETCEYGTLKNDLRDRLVVGIADQAL